ncbi:MAG TPA: hypothetical protein VL404_01225 [Candidatus Eisenbacteria bacterium]|jgi:hypothetical protein|nr:hypothetical protein [Candidatus Eisenbacteria bacterium]
MIQGLLRKLSAVAYDVTVGLLQQYKRTTIGLARIELAALYVRAVKLIRQECMIFTLLLFAMIFLANVFAVIQMAILLYAPWSVPGRIAAAIGFGIVSAVLPLLAVLKFFSEKRWMEMTKAEELIARAMESGPGTNGTG